jgi:hypothetical protein
MVRVGDILELPLKDGYKAYGQYISKSKMGPLIQIFDLILKDEPFSIEMVKTAKPLFPPIITGLTAAVREKLFIVVGKMPVIGFQHPVFVSCYWNQTTGKAHKWFFWDGEKYSTIGSKLPRKYRNLEYLAVWSPYHVIERIETGEYPFPYGDLIRHNKFTPRQKGSLKIIDKKNRPF